MSYYYRSYGKYKKADTVSVGDKRKFDDKIFTLKRIIPRGKKVKMSYKQNLKKTNYVRVVGVKEGLAVYIRKK